MEISTILAVAQAANTGLKKLREYSKDRKDQALNEMIFDTQNTLMELQEKIHDLGEENRKLLNVIEDLNFKLKIKGDIVYKQPFYYMPEDTNPYCPNCYENENKMIHLIGNVDRYYCATCLGEYTEDHRGWLFYKNKAK